MAINRNELLKKYSPRLDKVDFESSLQVGNGDFAFSCDPTGFQTFFDEYDQEFNPLTTMSNWGWHTSPNSKGEKFTWDDLVQNEYDYHASAREWIKEQCKDHKVHYPVHEQAGNEEVYNWLRQNPHRANLGILGLRTSQGSTPALSDVNNINQQLDLKSGVITSRYNLNTGNSIEEVEVEAFCSCENDTLFFNADSNAFKKGYYLELNLPYPSSKISGADFENSNGSSTLEIDTITHVVDDFVYYIAIDGEGFTIDQIDENTFAFNPMGRNFNLSLSYSLSKSSSVNNYDDARDKTISFWNNFWDSIGFVDFSKSTDIRVDELQRRIILSQYLLALNSSGSLPPQETGLMVNSWYGKFHLEMHLWHTAWLPLWGKTDLLEKSLSWYKIHTDQAKWNAQKNGFKGLRWPKMIGPDAIDSPSFIAPLLIWQQSHIIYLLELAYATKQTHEDRQTFAQDYWRVFEGTIDFICDYLSFEDGKYNIVGPCIPSQEEFDPETVKNPTFELAYWKFCLGIAIKWADRLNAKKDEWYDVYENIALPSTGMDVSNGTGPYYLAHENCLDTFPNFMNDHPSQLAIWGLIENSDIDVNAISNTLDRVLADWNEQSMWGWDYGYMAMLASKLNKPELAFDILLKECPKNYYAANGHNFQKGRTDLPAYLPGNGALLLAIAKILAPGQDSESDVHLSDRLPDGWSVEIEGVG